jgi:hypothetical protein
MRADRNSSATRQALKRTAAVDDSIPCLRGIAFSGIRKIETRCLGERDFASGTVIGTLSTRENEITIHFAHVGGDAQKGTSMKVMRSRYKRSAMLICSVFAGAALIGAALAQPGGGPGGGSGKGPGGGPGGPGGGEPGGGGQSSSTFQLQVCNETSDVPIIYVAIGSGTGNNRLQVTGWSQVARGNCVAGMFARPAILFHARAPNNVEWVKGLGSQFAPLCVNFNSDFKYEFNIDQQHQCAAGEQQANFVLQEVRNDRPIHRLELI